MSGWAITEWAVAVAAFLTAGGVILQKAVRPVIGFVRRFKAWMDRVEKSVMWTEQQMKPNGGSTLVDKVDVMQRQLKTTQEQVSLLLRHDAERDTAGKRYGDTTEEP